MKKIFIFFCIILGTPSIYGQFDDDFVETSVLSKKEPTKVKDTMFFLLMRNSMDILK